VRVGEISVHPCAVERRFGRYVVLSTLGSGAMGDVFRARDERLGREVAIKTVRNVGGLAVDVFRSRFDSEARALAALSHPAIVAVHDLGIEGDEPYLVMELVDGPSLKGVLANGPLGAGEVRAMGIQLARALESAHARGILHRDIKPANILRSSTGQWKLADFGIARVPDSELTITGQFLGTPAYAPPESISLGEFSDKSDVFALGTTMIEAATGARAKKAPTVTEVIRGPSQQVALPAEVPPELAPVLRAAIARTPADRPSAAQFAEMLAAASAPVVPTPSTRPEPGSTTPPGRRTPVVAGAAIAGAVIVVGVIAAFLASGSHAGTSKASGATQPPPDATRRPDAAVPPDALPARDLPPVIKGRVVVVYPLGGDRKAYDAYNKIADKVREHEYDDALERLDQYERKYGACPESQNLRAQLDAQFDSSE
jgi:hypothetical protein